MTVPIRDGRFGLHWHDTSKAVEKVEGVANAIELWESFKQFGAVEHGQPRAATFRSNTGFNGTFDSPRGAGLSFEGGAPGILAHVHLVLSAAAIATVPASVRTVLARFRVFHLSL